MTARSARARLRIGGLAVVALQAGAFLPIALGALYLLVFMPSAPSVAVIQATVETLSFDVAVPEMAQLRLTGFGLTYETATAQQDLGFRDRTIAAGAPRKPICLTGVLVPEPGDKVTYRRYGTGPITAVIERVDGRPAATFEIAAGALPPEARQASWLRLEGNVASDDDSKAKTICPGDTARRLPVFGVADVGSELRPVSRGDEPTSGALIEGTIDIFAQTIELAGFGETAPRIYPASGGSITIPPGSRITEYATAGAPRQPWAGFVASGTDEALSVKVTTPASRLAIVRPGLGLRPEVLSMSLFTQLSNDPTLVSAQIVAALLFSTLQIASATLRWLVLPRAAAPTL